MQESRLSPGLNVTILTDDGFIFSGQIIGHCEHGRFLSAHHEHDAHNGHHEDFFERFITIKLSAATGPFFIGEIVLINIEQFIAIG